MPDIPHTGTSRHSGALPRKVCILGPIPQKAASGGVAIFDIGLAEGFQQLGTEVFLCSEQSDDCPIRHYKIGLGSIRSVMEREQPELILASLQYGKYFPLLKDWGPKILMLHGFFNAENYGMAKTLAAVAYQKSMAAHADYVLANSNLTKVLNMLFWNLPVHGVIPLGTTRDFIRQAEREPTIRNAASRRVVYVGRLAKSKQVDKIVRAALLLHGQGFSFLLGIAGYGGEEPRLRQLAAGDAEIVFEGYVPHEEIFPYFHQAEIFVSLSESEPFGITFAEALMAGCKIVCPNTGGQTEFLSRYPDRVRFLTDTRPETIAAALRELLDKPVAELPSAEVCPLYDYTNTARHILSFLRDQPRVTT